MKSFAGKVVMVTGATSGIGQATAVAFAKAGASVVALGRRAAEGQATIDQVRRTGSDGIFVQTDIASEVEVVKAIAAALTRFGKIDCAANCAGIDTSKGLLDYTEQDYEEIFGTNVKGLFFCLKHEIRAMQAGGGAIVTIGSISAGKSTRGNSLYDASKGAARRLTQTVALEASAFGIRVNEIAPGPVATPMLDGFFQKAALSGSNITADSIIPNIPLARIGQPEEIADAAVFLCSDNAAYITGTILTIDGGYRLT
jgi:NAD(P)-dependent dehydrogenase (short-subunit alcohol dehydrogenase family)